MQFAEDELLPYLSKGQHVVVAESGHAEMLWSQPEASERLLNSFYDTGEADDSLFIYQPWEYNVGMGFPLLAKLLVAIIILTPFLLVGLAWLIYRRIRNRRAGGPGPRRIN